MTSISSLGASNAWSIAGQHSQRLQPPQKLSEKLQADFDADGSGALDATELQSLMDDMATRTGHAASTGAQDLLNANDSDGDGSLSTAELEAALPGMMPAPPSTMDFAQARGAGMPVPGNGTRDDLFAKVDSDGSGDLSSDELTALVQKIDGSATDEDTKALFGKLDSDGDGALSQAEFDAARPQNAAAMPPPPPPRSQAASDSAGGGTAPVSASAGGAGAAGAAGSATTVYDELDTNEDGVVSLAERLAGAVKDAQQADSAGAAGQLASKAQDWAQHARDALQERASHAYRAIGGQAEPVSNTIDYAV